MNRNIEMLRKLIKEALLIEGVYDPNILKAIFLAGGPGSGKSYSAKLLFGGDVDSAIQQTTDLGLKIVNSDPAFEKFLRDEGVDPGDLSSMSDEEFAAVTAGPESARGRASDVKKRQQQVWSGGRLGLILDGTGDDYNKILAKKQVLESLGYDTFMLFVNTSLEVAQERNKRRDRKLPKKLVEKIWTNVQANLGAFQQLFIRKDFLILDNTEYGPLPKEIQTGALEFLSRPITNPIGKEWIEQELERKGEKDIERKAPGVKQRLLGAEEETVSEPMEDPGFASSL